MSGLTVHKAKLVISLVDNFCTSIRFPNGNNFGPGIIPTFIYLYGPAFSLQFFSPCTDELEGNGIS